jgi:hypothetical protein
MISKGATLNGRTRSEMEVDVMAEVEVLDLKVESHGDHVMLSLQVRAQRFTYHSLH